MNTTSVKCSVLLKLRSREKHRQQCSRPATRILRIIGRVAVVACELDHGENPDIALDGFVDLVDLPVALRRVARGHIERQLKELDVEMAELQERRAKLAAEREQLADVGVPGEQAMGRPA